jgi:hypothetical protein
LLVLNERLGILDRHISVYLLHVSLVKTTSRLNHSFVGELLRLIEIVLSALSTRTTTSNAQNHLGLILPAYILDAGKALLPISAVAVVLIW